ncbi:unnamed protein product [Schistocephalus solidus]|uniref:[F-actin]-monooxygenase MICAL1-3-like Rossman domain-containing protein n=1 Tax=Schistocephalus solidus TaxID=70667 RepID=A0A183SDH2_SCHSO|nr:unnamed protein product [Schistocephalus solidus]
MFSRHNILHLWPFLIHDLKSLGAKTFFGKFCAGSIDHISIRTLQCILLKVALLFGVQVITGVTFTRLVEPSESASQSQSHLNPDALIVTEEVGSISRPSFPSLLLSCTLTISLLPFSLSPQSSLLPHGRKSPMAREPCNHVDNPGESVVLYVTKIVTHDSEGTVNGYGDGLPDLSETRSSRPLFTFYDGKRARYGWRAEFKPFHRSLSSFEFDVLIGAAGKSNSCLDNDFPLCSLIFSTASSLAEFPRKELRCRLAIAVTANFVNYNTADEARVEEISGVASIFNQQYFSLISKTLGIELENLVYYKDETHYFVMTAKKHSLLSKGVLKKASLR